MPYIPADITDLTKDSAGGALQYSGRVPRDAQMKQSFCFTFDGVNDRIDQGATALGLPGSGNWEVSLRLRLNNVNKQQYIFTQSLNVTNNNRTTMYVSSGNKLVLFLGNGAGYATQTITGSATLAVSTWYHIRFVKTGAQYQILLDGVADATFNDTDANRPVLTSGTIGNIWGAWSSNATNYTGATLQLFLDGSVCGRSLSGSAVPRQLPDSEGDGSGNGGYVWNMLNTTGNTFNNAVTNGQDSNWSVKQDIFHYLPVNGLTRSLYFDNTWSCRNESTYDHSGNKSVDLEIDFWDGGSTSFSQLFATDNNSPVGARISSGRLRLHARDSGNTAVGRDTLTIVVGTLYQLRVEWREHATNPTTQSSIQVFDRITNDLLWDIQNIDIAISSASNNNGRPIIGTNNTIPANACFRSVISYLKYTVDGVTIEHLEGLPSLTNTGTRSDWVASVGPQKYRYIGKRADGNSGDDKPAKQPGNALNTPHNQIDFVTVENSPDLRNYTIPGNGAVADFALTNSTGHLSRRRRGPYAFAIEQPAHSFRLTGSNTFGLRRTGRHQFSGNRIR
jgi:hypothetical protein